MNNPTVTIIPAYAGCEFEEAGSGERYAIIAWRITCNEDSVQVDPILASGLSKQDIDGMDNVYINGQTQV